jgi:hypothetical protein
MEKYNNNQPIIVITNVGLFLDFRRTTRSKFRIFLTQDL